MEQIGNLWHRAKEWKLSKQASLVSTKDLVIALLCFLPALTFMCILKHFPLMCAFICNILSNLHNIPLQLKLVRMHFPPIMHILTVHILKYVQLYCVYFIWKYTINLAVLHAVVMRCSSYKFQEVQKCYFHWNQCYSYFHPLSLMFLKSMTVLGPLEWKMHW